MQEQTTFNTASVTIFKTLVVLVFAGLFFSGCEKICDCAKSTGTIISESRSTALFNQIELYNNIDLVIHIDSTPRIKVTAGKNLISEITTESNDGILRIKNTNNCNWTRDFNTTMIVEVWTPSLNYLMAKDGSGDIYFEDSLDCTPRFTFDGFSGTGQYHFKLKGNEAHLNINNGPADLSAKGTITNLYLYGAGYGQLDCVNLQSKFVFVTNRGTNSCIVDATQLIDATIYGIGNIYYKGSPTSISKNEFGTGKLISL
ncbi:MAG: GIN domain-containing protein [Bacteroidota bacterium]